MNTANTDFKVILNSNDANSWTGTKFIASYNLDLKQILRDDSLFDKEYSLTYNFISTKDPLILATSIFLLNLQFSNGASNGGIYQPSGVSTTGLLPFQYDPTGTADNYFCSGEQDNAPTYIANLRNLSRVTVQVTDNAYTTFANAAVNYILVLHFREVKK